ncbi:MAG: hypothetical protein R2939_14825 [Kofleriaceae bacterium]
MARAWTCLGLLAALAASHPTHAAGVVDVDAVRATAAFARREPGARCQVGRAYAGVDDPRAALYLASCPVSDVDARTTLAEVLTRLERSDAVRVELVVDGAPVWVTIDGSPADEVQAPATVWLPPGPRRFVATVGGQAMATSLELVPSSSAIVRFETPPAPTPAVAEVDFAETDAPVDDGIAGPPPKVEHPSLLPDRYQRRPDGSVADDAPPVGARSRSPRPARYGTIGFGLGVAASDVDLPGLELAAPLVATVDAVYMFSRGWGVQLRAEATRRGGVVAGAGPDATPGVFTLGLAALARRAVVEERWLGVAVVGGVRAGAAFEERFAGHEIHGTRLDALVGVALSPTPWRPLSLDVTVEHGLTPLLADARVRGITLSLDFQHTFP